MNEYVETILPFPQDIIGTPAHDDAGLFFRKAPNDPALNGPKKIIGGHSLHGSLGPPGSKTKREPVFGGGILASLFNVLLIKAGLHCDLADQLLVIIRISQLLCHLLADGAPAAAKLTADRNDSFAHTIVLLQHRILRLLATEKICTEAYPSEKVHCISENSDSFVCPLGGEKLYTQTKTEIGDF